MDSNLRDRLFASLELLTQHTDRIDYRNPREVFEYIEGNVTSLGGFWRNIAHNLDKFRGMTRKDANAAEVAYGLALALFDKITKHSHAMDDENEPPSEMVHGMQEVLKLLDQALINCPMEQSGPEAPPLALQLDTLHCVRAMILLQCGQLDLALVAINRALALTPSSTLFHVYKAQILIKLERNPEAYRLVKRYFHYYHVDNNDSSKKNSNGPIPSALYLQLQAAFCFQVIGDPQGEDDQHDPLQAQQQSHHESPHRFLEEVLRKLQSDATKKIEIAAGYDEELDDFVVESSDDDSDYSSIEDNGVDITSYDSEKDDGEMDYAEERLADAAIDAEDPYLVPYEPTDRNYSFDYRTELCLNSDGGKGRSVVANDEIPEGTLVFRERTYSLYVLEAAQMTICHYCARNVVNRFWPCAGCNQTIYCGPACGALHQKLYHRFECGTAAYWNSKSTSHVFRLLNRVGVEAALSAIAEQKNGSPPYDLVDYRKDEAQRLTRAVDKSSAQLKAEFRAQMSLLDHSEMYGVEYLNYNMSNAIECAIIACISQGFEFDQFSREQLLDLIGHCFIAVRRILTNAFRWSEYDEGTGEKRHIATCYHLMASLFNHSCEPNMEWCISSGYLYASAIRPIEPGEELTLSYGPNAAGEYFENRQKHLRENYFFQCTCSACLEEARLVLALQCTGCPGPVLPTPMVEDTSNDDGQHPMMTCMICFKAYSKGAKKLKLLKLTLAEFITLTEEWPTTIHSDECEDRFLSARSLEIVAQLKECLMQMLPLIYQGSVHLVQAIYAACKIFYHAGELSECIEWGTLLDTILPLKGMHLIVLPAEPDSQQQEMQNQETQEADTTELKQQEPHSALYKRSSAFVPNIEHMVFWTSIYKAWLMEQPSSYDAQLWGELLRYYKRLHKLIAWAIAHKKNKLNYGGQEAANNIQQQVKLMQEIEALEVLMVRKEDELQQLKQDYGGEVEFCD